MNQEGLKRDQHVSQPVFRRKPMLVRQDALERLQASNKWSIPLTVVGLVLTVICGVISLAK